MPIFYKNSACNGQTRLVGEVDFLTGAMPLLREEKIHGWPCKFYDNGVVMVGTTADRFSIKLLADEGAWFATKLRAELVARELATEEELPIDEAGEAAMATKEAAKARARAMKAALNITIKAEAVHARAAAVLARAELDVRVCTAQARPCRERVQDCPEGGQGGKARACAGAGGGAYAQSCLTPDQAGVVLSAAHRLSACEQRAARAQPPRSGGLWCGLSACGGG